MAITVIFTDSGKNISRLILESESPFLLSQRTPTP